MSSSPSTTHHHHNHSMARRRSYRRQKTRSSNGIEIVRARNGGAAGHHQQARQQQQLRITTTSTGNNNSKRTPRSRCKSDSSLIQFWSGIDEQEYKALEPKSPTPPRKEEKEEEEDEHVTAETMTQPVIYVDNDKLSVSSIADQEMDSSMDESLEETKVVPPTECTTHQSSKKVSEKACYKEKKRIKQVSSTTAKTKELFPENQDDDHNYCDGSESGQSDNLSCFSRHAYTTSAVMPLYKKVPTLIVKEVSIKKKHGKGPFGLLRKSIKKIFKK